MADFVAKWNKHLQKQSRTESQPQQPETAERPSQSQDDNAPPQDVPPQEDADRHDRKRLKSPTTSVKAGERERSSSPTRRSKGRAGREEDPSDFTSRPAPRARGRIWNEGEPPPLTRAAATSATTAQPQPLPSSSTRAPRRVPTRTRPRDPSVTSEEDASVSVIIKQPETRPISQDQLVTEVKGIYAGLVMVESKCIEVVAAQNAKGPGVRISNEQWQALIGLHRTLLYEHHDFFLASQHPSASSALQRLATKYAMPARMWRHGIHAFLELLRNRLPSSLEHMLAFIYLAYAAMALLYETVPAFEDTWIECLGDLSRYRMAIEDEDIRDREIWTGVSRYWYSKASDKAPTTGRLHHHLAILARPNAVQQLFYYTKSLCVPIPFKSSRDSILTLFNPILSGEPNRLQPVDVAFVKAHGLLFIASNTDEKEKALPKPIDELMSDYVGPKTDFLSELDGHIARTSRAWLEPGAFIAVSNCNSLLEYGKTDANTAGPGNIIMSIISPQATQGDAHMKESTDDVRPAPSKFFEVASELVSECDSRVFSRHGDTSVLAYLYVRLAFMKYMADKELAMKHLAKSFPWPSLCRLLNSFTNEFQHYDRIESKEFPRPNEGKAHERPLPEDWSLRGHIWTESLFPADHFSSGKVDYNEKTFELASMTEIRRERVLWLAVLLASYGTWIIYDGEQKQFMATAEFHQERPDFPAQDTTPAGRYDTLNATTLESVTTATATLDVDSVKGLKDSAESSDVDDMSMVVERSEGD